MSPGRFVRDVLRALAGDWRTEPARVQVRGNHVTCDPLIERVDGGFRITVIGDAPQFCVVITVTDEQSATMAYAIIKALGEGG